MTGVNGVGATGSSNNSKTDRLTEVTVKQGENLTIIAKRFGMTPKEFQAWTGLQKQNLNVGQKIALPTDTVPKGKGILALARANGMTLEDFCKLNKISKDYQAKQGEVFYVKKKTTSTTATTQKDTTSTQAKPATPAKQKPQPKPATPAKTAPKSSVSDNKKRYASSFTPTELGKKIYEKSGEYRGAVGKPDFDSLINEINSKNVEEVLKNYTKKESLLTTITHEVSSDSELRKKAVMKIYDAMAKAKNTTPALRERFVKELDSQFNSWGMVSTKQLDKILNNMMLTPSELGAKIYKESSGLRGIGAVGERDFDTLIDTINPSNVSEVLTEYTKNEKNKDKESLINTITSEVSSSEAKRKDAVMKVYDALATAKGTPKENRAKFEAELKAQFDKTFGMVDTTKLDGMINEMLGISGAQQADKTSTTTTTTPAKPKGAVSPAEAKRQDILKWAKKSIEDRFYNDGVDSRGNKYKSFRTMLVEQIQNDPKLTPAQKKERIAKAKTAKLDMSEVSRPWLKLNADGSIDRTPEVEELAPTGKSNGKVIILNEGHGGYTKNSFDGGAFSFQENPAGSNSYKPIEEFKAVKPYSKDLATKLRAAGYTVVRCTGELYTLKDYDTLGKLNQKYTKKFGTNNTMFISLHCDSGSASQVGSDVCFNPHVSKDADLAKIMQTSLNQQNWIKAGKSERPYKVKNAKGQIEETGNLYVLNQNKNIPSVLLEIEYLSGVRSLNITSGDYRKQFVDATFGGIEEYFKTHK